MVKDPKEISFLDIYESIEGKINIEQWTLDSFMSLLLGSVTKKMTDDFVNYMSKTFVADFI